MKTKTLFASLVFLSISGVVFAQKNKEAPQSIISRTAVIKKYHNTRELSEMPKGVLLDLCIERVQVLAKILPYVSLATKPGVTLTDFGIPGTAEVRKLFIVQEESTKDYLEKVSEYEKTILPYADKDDLVKAVLFYENIMKSLHEFDEM